MWIWGRLLTTKRLLPMQKTILGTVTNDAATVTSGLMALIHMSTVLQLLSSCRYPGAVVLTIDSVTSGSLDVASEEDLFSVTLSTASAVYFTLTSAVLDKPGVRLFDALECSGI